ncbi:G protein pathway suppressor 2-like isoform X2 [Ruditapes philippinarum]|uniref:G protein pathway suppressor 2-like isoform X2 n=1 Tax=Ruditapes philippinarum TaxID=129788 RepID=UPI00295C3309|nr:G protein pathway suppressor 2-like isoform X2 [Ruditapes philippinarum]
MPALLERPKMTKLMYQTLKRHILSERERKKQAEQEQDAMLEQQRKEREMKKKKEEDNNLTIEQTKEQISQLEKKLEQLGSEKHELFSQLKKVLHQEDETRKRTQLKEQSELMSVQAPYTHPAMPPVSAHSMHLGRPTMYRPTQSMITVTSVPNVPMKRPRSPSPTPTSGYQHPYESKKAVAMYSHSAQDFKSGTYPAPAQQGQVTFVSQPVHSFQQSTVSYSTCKPTPGKYQPASQSAFSTYPSHYAQHQKTIPEQQYPAAYQMQRLQQPGYLASPHSANIPLQQQLQHANEKAGFNEGEKYKMQQPAQIRGVAPIQGQQPGMLPISLQQEMPGRGSIVTGFARSQAPPTSSYQPSSSQVMYPGQQPGGQGRPGYNNQGRYH